MASIARFGSISSGTMRAADLIPAFSWELRRLAEKLGPTPDLPVSPEIALCNEADNVEDYESDEASELLEELSNALSEHAPAYGYFGAHPGDGADFGFWLSEFFEQDFDGLKVSDTSEVPADYSGEVLHVNDHGNCTLYSANNGELTEIWGLV